MYRINRDAEDASGGGKPPLSRLAAVENWSSFLLVEQTQQDPYITDANDIDSPPKQRVCIAIGHHPQTQGILPVSGLELGPFLKALTYLMAPATGSL